jgi:four helix bundle protein
MKDYHKLDIWSEAMSYCERIYEFAHMLPVAERYNLSDQIRRAVVSIPLNIAEGAGCDSEPDFRRFLWYAYRSVHEVVTCLELARRLKLSSNGSEGLNHLLDTGDKLAAMIYRFIKRLESDRRSAPSGKRIAGRG